MKRLVAVMLISVLLCACGKAPANSEYEPEAPSEIGSIGESASEDVPVEESQSESEPEPPPLEALEVSAEDAKNMLKPDESGLIPIAKREELAALAALVNSGETFAGQKFAVQNDISMRGYSVAPIGHELSGETHAFEGEFDGQGCIVSGLAVRADDGVSGAGLFGIVGERGSVSNLHLVSGDIIGHDSTGGLAGQNFGAIYNCSFNGAVTADGAAVGGLVGLNGPNSSIENSFCNAEVRGAGNTGAFAGQNFSTIRDSYGLGSVISVAGKSPGEPQNIGGFIGDNGGSIERCFSSGEVYTNVASRLVGGFCGYNGRDIAACYYNEASTSNWKPIGQSENEIEPDINGCTVEELVERETYEGWDFDTVWTIDGVKNRGLPYLISAGL